jgi:capsular exopolysaccharide synthesis family protein
MTEPDSQAQVTGPAPAHSFSGLISFLRAVQCRKRIVFLALLVSGLLGALYYITATPYFESSAQLLIVATNADVLEGSTATNQVFQSILPTYCEVVLCDEVLDVAAAALPREHRIDFKGVPEDKRAAALREQLSVSPSRKGNIISVEFLSREPRTAAVVVDAVLNSYLKFMDDTHQTNSQQYLDVLTQEKDKSLKELNDRQNELLRLKRESQLLIGVGDTTLSVATERVVNLNVALGEAKQRTVEAQALLVAIERAIQNGEDLEQFSLPEMESISRMLMMQEMSLGGPDGMLVSKAQQELREDEAKLSTKLQFYGPNHPLVRELQEKMAKTRQWLEQRPAIVGENARHLRNRQLAPRLLQMARQKYQYALAQEGILRQQLEQEETAAFEMNGQLAQIQFLELEVQRLRTNLDNLLDRMTTIDLGQNGGLKTRIVSPPRVPTKPVSPRLTTVALVCLSAGLGAALGLIYVIDTLDDRFRSPEDIRRQLGIPVLAMVRALEPTGEVGIRAVHTFANPNGVESEAFRTLRTTLNLFEDSTQRIVASSTEPGDGKTTVMANLCVAFAQSGKRTLLIDADMRRPGMTTLLAFKGPRGLSTILRDVQPIAECAAQNVRPSGAPNLDVIPSGPRPMNPAELLASDRFSELLAWAETTYDQVVVDAPPALAVADPAIVGRLADGVLLVVRPERNKRRMVIRAAETFTGVGIPVLGVVANHISAGTGGDYYGYGYGYGYGYEYGNGHDDSSEREEAFGDETRGALIGQRAGYSRSTNFAA